MRLPAVIVEAGDVVARMTLTVRVRGLRRVGVRVWLGLRLLRLAVRVIGVQRLDVVDGGE